MSNAQHAIFTVERKLDCPVEMVFTAWSDPKAKEIWFAAPAEMKDVIREQNFHIGGRDRYKGTWPDGRTSDFRAEYWDIVPNERIVYVYEMHINGVKISVSLATIQFLQSGKGSKMIVTEQGAFLDGYDDAGAREHGTNIIMDSLVAYLSRGQ